MHGLPATRYGLSGADLVGGASKNFSAPIVAALSPGGVLPGQTSTTCGLSAAITGHSANMQSSTGELTLPKCQGRQAPEGGVCVSRNAIHFMSRPPRSVV